MVKLLGTSLSLLLIGASAARADEAYDACMKTATSNVDFGQCGGAYVKRADDALNAAWKQTYKLATGQTAKDLLAEEQAWIAYKRSPVCSTPMARGVERARSSPFPRVEVR
jgi:uncharacterized protein YecT (DUF1311 family)